MVSNDDRSKGDDKLRRALDSQPSNDPSASEDFAKAVGRAIKVIRTDLGIERRDLAEAAGISYSYLTEIENGNKPASSKVLRPIASALGMRLSQLAEAAEMRLDNRRLSMDACMDDSVLPSAIEAPMRMLRESVPSPRPRLSVDKVQYLALQPSLRGEQRELRAAILELERLLERMAPDDIERLLDYARRLSR